MKTDVGQSDTQRSPFQCYNEYEHSIRSLPITNYFLASSASQMLTHVSEAFRHRKVPSILRIENPSIVFFPATLNSQSGSRLLVKLQITHVQCLSTYYNRALTYTYVRHRTP